MTIERGIILPDSNPQKEIQKHSETTDWEYREYSKFLYEVGSEMMSRFFNGLVYPDGKKVPNPLFAFDDARNNNVLGTYDLKPDEYGLMYKITINTAHFDDGEGGKEYKYGKWSLCEVTLHEMVHVWQQHGRGKEPYKPGRHPHNKEFCLKAKELGLNVFPVVGFHYQVADEGSPFSILMRQFGIKRPDDVPTSDEKPKGNYFEIGRKRKGRSSLTKYSCGCQNAWIGSAEFHALCTNCGNEFVKATALRQMLYSLSGPEDDPEEFDVDAEIDRRQEAEDERIDREVEDYEGRGIEWFRYDNDYD